MDSISGNLGYAMESIYSRVERQNRGGSGWSHLNLLYRRRSAAWG